MLVNDLQPAALALAPEIEEALDAARAAGADVAMVSGSGPTVLGLFLGPDGPKRARERAGALADRRPAPLVAEPEPNWPA
jgi:4-diphosphocytidyl-2-C-methyl-D-erythritol kinase